MAFLTTGNFYTATFLPTTDAAWAALTTQPFGISGELAGAIFRAAPTPIQFYVVDDVSGQVAYVGGQAIGLDDTLLNGAAVAMTAHVLPAEDASNTIWGFAVTGGLGKLYQYDYVASVLRTYDNTELTAFKAYIASIP